MFEKIITYDLGTGGIKTSLFTVEGRSLANTFLAYDTVYPQSNMHEQAPDVWWKGIKTTTHDLIKKTNTLPQEVVGMAISGHSLGVVPVDSDGNLLREFTPIWSDTRAESQAEEFFARVDYDEWYLRTGNGFPPECYALFKIMWYRDNEPDMFKNVHKILGSKDYCNLLLTGRMCTDRSYASGSGAFDLKSDEYIKEYVNAADLDMGIFPEIIKSHAVVGNLTQSAAEELGLGQSTKVICGGVDNSCMALGAKGFSPGRAYTSLGSSSWIAVVDESPIVDTKYKPYVFSHVVEGMFASATSIFSAGNSYRWVRDHVFADLVEKERTGEIADAYVQINMLAEKSPIGANSLMFNPSLAGGSMIEEDKRILGGFVGMSLRHTREDIARSTLEGITYNLRYALDILRGYCPDISDMLIVGGGSKSEFWRQMFADIFGIDVIKTDIGQDCASLGAAALVAYGLGYWQDYSPIDELHGENVISTTNREHEKLYEKYYNYQREFAHYMAEIGKKLGE